MEEKTEKTKGQQHTRAITLISASLLIMLLALSTSTKDSEIVPAVGNADLVARLKEARPDLEFRIVGASTISGYIKVAVNDGPKLHVSGDASRSMGSG